MTSSDGSNATLRADARRNREQIIDAARTLFVQRGPDVPMEEIARSAGVGVGTLYRRFPDRDELIRAVSVDNFERLRALARQVEEEEPDPDAALVRLLQTALKLRLGFTLDVLSPHSYEVVQSSAVVAEIRGELAAIMSRIVRRAQEEGSLRADIAVGDVGLALITLAKLVPPSGMELGEMAFARLFALMLDGLRAVSGSPLPGRPVTAEDLDSLRTSGGLLGRRRRASG